MFFFLPSSMFQTVGVSLSIVLTMLRDGEPPNMAPSKDADFAGWSAATGLSATAGWSEQPARKTIGNNPCVRRILFLNIGGAACGLALAPLHRRQHPGARARALSRKR